MTATFADMNGNGSQDVVYVDRAKSTVQFLELFPAAEVRVKGRGGGALLVEVVKREAWPVGAMSGTSSWPLTIRSCTVPSGGAPEAGKSPSQAGWGSALQLAQRSSSCCSVSASLGQGRTR